MIIEIILTLALLFGGLKAPLPSGNHGKTPTTSSFCTVQTGSGGDC